MAIQVSNTEQPYSRLYDDQIRVLVLEPGSPTDVLRGSFATVALQDEPVFKAISYCWGTSPYREAIVLSNSYQLITQSLFTALVKFRSPTEHVRLWDDAICISQDDPEEKAKQVSMMAKIYEAAEEVLVWLGEGGHGTCKAYWTLHTVAGLGGQDRVYRRSNEGRTVTDDFEAQLEQLVGNEHCDFCDIPMGWAADLETRLVQAFTALYNLVSSAWFTRMWVVQEVYAGRSVTFHSGLHKIELWDMIDSVLALRSMARFESRRISVKGLLLASLDRADLTLGYIDRLRNDPQRIDEEGLGLLRVRPELTSRITDQSWNPTNKVKAKGPGLLRVLMNTLELHVTVPRDRVYAIRNLAQITDVKDFEPYYDGSDLITEMLWVTVSRYILTSSIGSDPEPEDYAHPATMLALCAFHDAEDVGRDQTLQSVLAASPAQSLRYAPGRQLPSKVSLVCDFNRVLPGASRKWRFYVQTNGDFSAGGSATFSPSWWHPRPHRFHYALFLKGKFLCTLNDVDPRTAWPQNLDRSNADFEQELIKWYIICKSYLVEKGPQMPEDEFVLFLRRGCALENPDKIIDRSHPGFEEFSTVWRDLLREPDREDQQVLFGSPDATASAFRVLEIFLTWGGEFWFVDPMSAMGRTSDDQLVWVPVKAQSDDEICVVEGAPCPVVLQPYQIQSDHSTTYRVRGDAYVPGVMHGEAWSRSVDPPIWYDIS